MNQPKKKRPRLSERKKKRANNFMDGIIILWFLIYFVPAITAYEKKKKDKGAILALNILLGWSIIGWIIALIWAIKKD